MSSDTAQRAMQPILSAPSRLRVPLGRWDYLFRALALSSVLLFAALAFDLVANPTAPTFGDPTPPIWARALIGLVVTPLGVLVSALILWRAPGNIVGRFLLLVILGATGWQFSFGIGSPEFASVAYLLFYLYWGAVGFPSLAYLLMHFPDGSIYPPGFRSWLLLYAPLKLAGTALEIISIRPASSPFFRGGPGDNPFFVAALEPYQPLLTIAFGGTGLIILPAMLAGVISLVSRYRVATVRERLQIKWLIWAAVVIILTMPAYFLAMTDLIPTSDMLLIPIYISLSTLPVLAVGISILRYHLLDIDLILNRTLVYGALTTFVIGSYGLIVGYLSTIFHSDNVLSSLIAAGLIAILFQPLRERLQRAVNRLIYGGRSEPYKVLTRLGQRLEEAAEPTTVLPLTAETVAQALKLPYVAITLKQGGSFVPVAAYGTPQNGLARLPLVYASEIIGELLVASRSPGEPLTSADRRLLGDLSRQISVAAHAALLSTDLERMRLRIVTAREEARRRLGSDLHDGVGHQLTALARKVELATGMLEHDSASSASDTLRALGAELTGQLNSTIAQVRSLAHQLHPPELEFLGLAGALRERAQLHSQNGLLVWVDASEKLPPLPAAVETAAYYIALEALTNVEKHSRARSCTIRLGYTNGGSTVEPPTLELDVIDDGRGLPDEQADYPGLGLLSMQARAAEVGGVCRIQSDPQGGTRISTRLPCPTDLD